MIAASWAIVSSSFRDVINGPIDGEQNRLVRICAVIRGEVCVSVLLRAGLWL